MPGFVRKHSSNSITIADGIFASASRTPQKIAIREGERSLTYSRLAERIVRLANVVHGHFGLAHGERAAVLMPNRIEYLEIVCGLSSAGVAACTIGPAASGAEIRFICEDSSSRVLFVAPALEALARASVGDIVPHIVCLDEGYEALLANARPDALPVATDWEDIFSIPYTSGSTGRPKGVMLSHRCRVLSSYAMASEHGCYGPDDRAVATTPMFHGSGFLMALAPVFFGGFVELLPAFNIEQLMRKIQEVSATSVYMVPTHFSSLFAMGDGRHAFNHGSLKCVIVGTAPLSQAMKVRIVEYMGEGKLFERYGSTEASIVTALRPKDQLRKQQCVGLPLAATQIRILDDKGEELPPGQVGELYSTSNYMFSGYLNMPDAMGKAMRGEWFSAGDLGRLDDEGYLYLVDRKHDMIISGGENVYPREVEEVLLAHPAIDQAAVIGIPHEHWGEQVVAFVVVRSGMNVSGDELKQACGSKLSRYKIPKEFRMVRDLPRNRMGKIDRRELRASAANGSPSASG
ncbi:class I adenylate-forming enzyme family protein [Rhodoplanes sp. Z2-YC6860]|uniref:class I adenylate-forming enzyme family protein n=1 Tax=Rhodoplanes sp. Z2-YC6860 TaxID=674703 RepID=UPI00082EE1BA|nr:class I adenylate-forming enzyme family protein [Rhodoplanes sp. Z2-YC6860]